MRKKDDGPWWLKIIANILSTLVVYAILSLWEFWINPNNNYSVEVQGDTIAFVKGVQCKGDSIDWQFAITDTAYASKYSATADLLLWQQNRGEATNQQMIKVKESQLMNLPACENETTDIAYIWDISSMENYMFLRVHPGFNVKVYAREQPLPVLNDIGFALRHITWPIFLWTLVLYALPVFIGEELYDLFNKYGKVKKNLSLGENVALAFITATMIGFLWLNLSALIISSQPIVMSWLNYIRPFNTTIQAGYPVYAYQFGLMAAICAFVGITEPLWIRFIVPLLTRLYR